MKTDIFNDQWIDIVFQGRNQEYGAYSLRKLSAKNGFVAVIVAVSVILLLAFTPRILSLLESAQDESAVKMHEETTLAEPPPIDKNEPPPPPVEPPPPLKTTIKFTPPVIVKDEEVTDTVRTVEELKEVDLGAQTQQGDSVNGVDPSLIEAVAEDPDAGKVFTIVEQMPEFPGGEAKMLEFIQKNVKYPAIAKDNGISGTVFLNFVINKDGQVTDIKILRGIGGGCDEEATRVVKAMPGWKVGKQNGRPVNVSFNLPIKFTLR
jgi:protein TonB